MTRLAILLCLLPLLAMDDAGSCDPTSLEAAGVRPGDGGFWVGPDGGQFVSNTELIDFKKRPMPPDDILCMLLVGDLNDQNDYDKWQGIWIEDIKAPWFLGPVESGGDTRDNESAQLRYTYCDPSSNVPGCMETLTLILRFESITAVTMPATDGIPWPQPYFLNGITAMGMDRVQMELGTKAPTCWDWKYRETPEYRFVPCPDCKTLGEDFSWCNSAVTEDPRDCFRRGEAQ